ncbi:extracellular solute-binding protein [Streptomyces phyllanthi]|uniref:Extracellular solute-binding protein n=1 Tax=Streptomyces phyllanthi TaxID=1803180 RepID=A0A5N8WHG5_9ACTN|nr:extracellular solute-binding protein [Streptomyces phyllanthi]MPY46667.1 extracellular solute-binding protein [Streptomyces phyllanthi]
MASALGLTAVLAGCAGLGTPGSGEVTLRLVAADYGDSEANSSQKYWDALVEEYEADHPDVRVEVSVYSWNDVDRKVKEMVAAGKAPDMAQIGAYADYAAQDLLHPVGELLSIPVQADLLPQLSEAGRVKRTAYGMPFVASTRVLFYNKKLFADAGITDAPKSWNDLAADAAVLKADGVRIPYALPLGPEEAQAETMQWLLSGGDGYTDDIGNYQFDSEANVDTFTWLKDRLVDKGLTGPTPPAELNRADAFTAFTNGEVGMLNGHPTLMKTATEKGVKFGMVPMPGRGGRSTAHLGVADWMMAFKQNGHREEIGDFLDFVYSDKNVLAFARMYDLLPVTTSASRIMSDTESDAALAPFLAELPDTEFYPVGKTSWAEVSAAVKKRMGKAVAPGGSPKAVLDGLQRMAESADAAGEEK